MRLTTSIAALALVAGGLVATTGSSAYAVEDCFGLTPTIVAGPGGDGVIGTQGDDVIVDPHGHDIRSLGGNDAICAIGSDFVDAGEGDDKVSVQGAEKGNLFALGAGSDQYVGSDADERVVSGSFDATDILQGEVGDTDTITTFGGKDRVFSLTRSYPNADVIDLGAGPDSIMLSSDQGASFTVEAGAGKDHIELDQYGIAGDLALDLSSGSVEIDGPTTALATGFEDATVSSEGERVTLYGTSEPNQLSVEGDGQVFAGGGGDTVVVDGCGSTAVGEGGADHLKSVTSGRCASYPVVLVGGPGNDNLRGSRGRDVLLGQSGRDTARGGKGRDTCRAEIKRACETHLMSFQLDRGSRASRTP